MIGLLGVPPLRRSVRGKLFDAVAQTEALGLTVVGVYDALIGATTSSWVDARGTTSGGPTISFPNGVTLANGVYTFNGTDQYGRASNGRLSEITANVGIVVIGALPTAGSRLFDASSGSAGTILRTRLSTNMIVEAPTGTPASATVTTASGVRVFHSRRTGNVAAGRMGAGTEVTGTGTLTDGTVSRFTLAADRSDTAALFGNPQVRTVVLIKGDHLTASQAIWNEYGAMRGATV